MSKKPRPSDLPHPPTYHYDTVCIPRARLEEFTGRPFEDVWATAEREGLTRKTQTHDLYAPPGYALLRRGPADQTFLLHQNW